MDTCRRRGRSEIEGLVTITDTPTAELLRERGADAARSTWSLDTVLQGRCHPHTSGRQSRSRGQRHGFYRVCVSRPGLGGDRKARAGGPACRADRGS